MMDAGDDCHVSGEMRVVLIDDLFDCQTLVHCTAENVCQCFPSWKGTLFSGRMHFLSQHADKIFCIGAIEDPESRVQTHL